VVTHLPRIHAEARRPSLHVRDLGPLVGRGSLRFWTVGEDGRRRAHFAAVHRRLRTVALRLHGPADRALDLAAAPVRADTLWVDDPNTWERLHRPADGRAGWSTRRTLAAGTWLEREDLQATPVVHRGQHVEWRVREGELAVTLSVKARRDGAVGEWILVQSPLDGQLKRVCVIGPGRVSQHPPPRDGADPAEAARGGGS
jgi:hypothetical protein